MFTILFFINIPQLIKKSIFYSLLAILRTTLILTIYLFSNLNNSWIAIFLFLLFIGGIIILFSYITIISFNETESPKKLNILAIYLTTFYLFLLINTFYSKPSTKLNFNILRIKAIEHLSFSFLIIIIVMTIFLFIVLVNIITNKWAGPIRSSN